MWYFSYVMFITADLFFWKNIHLRLISPVWSSTPLLFDESECVKYTHRQKLIDGETTDFATMYRSSFSIQTLDIHIRSVALSRYIDVYECWCRRNINNNATNHG